MNLRVEGVVRDNTEECVWAKDVCERTTQRIGRLTGRNGLHGYRNSSNTLLDTNRKKNQLLVQARYSCLLWIHDPGMTKGPIHLKSNLTRAIN